MFSLSLNQDRAMETYAKHHHLSGDDVTELFHKWQVFEKIMIQHEYLHQVSFDETLEYVSRIIEENSILKIKRFDSLNEEWLEFIKENRVKGGTQHCYDVVIGSVADDNTMETVQLYISGVLTVKEAVMRFYKSQTYKTLRNTENTLWAESAEYIADRYEEEVKKLENPCKSD